MTAPYVSYVRFRRVDGTEYRKALYTWWISPNGYYQEHPDGKIVWHGGKSGLAAPVRSRQPLKPFPPGAIVLTP